jgi:hypothetical protein
MDLSDLSGLRDIRPGGPTWQRRAAQNRSGVSSNLTQGIDTSVRVAQHGRGDRSRACPVWVRIPSRT